MVWIVHSYSDLIKFVQDLSDAAECAARSVKMNKAEMNQSEMNAAPTGRKKYPWTLKRVLAWVLIAALVWCRCIS